MRDAGLHRSRVEGRQRHIPNWYELDWDHVERARSTWVPPDGLDLVLTPATPVEENAERLRAPAGGAVLSGPRLGGPAQRRAMSPAGVGAKPHAPT